MGKSIDFEKLVAAYGHDLYRFAFWLSHDQHGAEDLVQETFLRAWRNFRQLRDAASVKSWLLTTLRREYYRRRPPAEVCNLEDELLIAESERFEVRQDVDVAIEIEQRLSALPTSYREVLVLQLLFGYSTQEIASIVDTTEAAVANRLLRARRSLRTGAVLAVCSRRRAP